MALAELNLLWWVLITISVLKIGTDLAYSLPIIWHKNQSKREALLPPVSVIICARNESDNLIEFLPSILEQDYPEFEVVVVNDRSIDDSQLVLRALKNRHTKLTVTHVTNSELHWAGKKFALTLGIKAAKHDLVVLTDADCYPSSNKWLAEMSKQFTRYKKVVLGYGAYKKTKGLLNMLIRAEAMMIAQQYMGLAKLGLPYMGVGRNLAYHKDLFFENRGFASHQFMPSGDDDLFINEVASGKNTTICISPESFTLSNSELSWKNWISQKRRHLTTGHKYNLQNKISLLWLSIIRYSFLTICIWASLSHPYWWIGLSAVLFNSMLVTILHIRFAKKTHSTDLLWIAGITEIFLLFYYPFLFIYNTFVSGSPWKNY